MGSQHLRRQQLAQLIHVGLQRRRRRRRRICVPQVLDEAISAHQLIGSNQQHREQRPAFGARHLHHAGIGDDFQRSEDPEFHGAPEATWRAPAGALVREAGSLRRRLV